MTCQVCGSQSLLPRNPGPGARRKAEVCSRACYRRARQLAQNARLRARRASKNAESRRCNGCAAVFVPGKRARKYCTRDCMIRTCTAKHLAGPIRCARCGVQVSRAYHQSSLKYCAECTTTARAEIRRSAARRYSQTPRRKISTRIGVMIRKCLIRRGWSKRSIPTFQLLGYSIDELRAHLEARFSAGMSWSEFCAGRIHIDHIRPLASFRFDSIESEEFRQAWALDNLQPLWAWDNLRKGARWSGACRTLENRAI